jgi:hypothetical protein
MAESTGTRRREPLFLTTRWTVVLVAARTPSTAALCESTL